MERVAKSTAGSRFAARPSKPDPHGHALLLIGTYGMNRALQIAQANRSLASPDPYWAEVLAAVEAGERIAATPPQSFGAELRVDD